MLLGKRLPKPVAVHLSATDQLFRKDFSKKSRREQRRRVTRGLSEIGVYRTIDRPDLAWDRE